MRRLIAAVSAVLAVPALIALPVITGPQATIAPVTPTVSRLALTGIDPQGLATSPAPRVAPADPSVQQVDDAAVADPATASVAAPRTGATTARVLAVTGPRATSASRPQPKPVPVAPLAPAAVTREVSTAPFSLVAVSWKGAAPTGTAVQVRVRQSGTWTPWESLSVDAEHGPDPGSAEADRIGVRQGTDPLLTAPGSDGVQVRIDTPGGVIPADASVSLVDPKTSEADVLAASTPPATAAAAGDPLKPAIITRAQWGADESLRNSGPVYTGPIKVGFVHHTASTNNYTADTAAAQVRALYAYFTLSLGYSDIAYNFFVDRFGRLYEGRAGGMDKNVLGGHTAGFNQNTFAVSAIGNFESYKPTSTEGSAMSTAIARLMAWKLALNHADPTGMATLVSNSSAGTSKYAVGETATVPVISGHRDIGLTACPGQYLETYLPGIRAKAKAYMGTQLLSPVLAPSVQPYGGTGGSLSTKATTAAAWKLEVFSACQATPIRTTTGSIGAAGTITAGWDQKAADGKPALPGTYRLVLSALNGSAVAYPVSTTLVVTDTATSPLGPCTQVARIGETERYSASVRTAAIVAPTSRTVVLAPGADSYLPEALIAAPLARAKNAALLLTGTTTIPPAVASDITRRHATTAYVVGTSTQVSSTVASQLKSLGVTTVVRLAGTTRSGTATAVAGEMGARTRALVVSFSTGSSLDVATSASAMATALNRPLLVVGTSTVPAVTSAAMKTLGISATTVVGSATAITDGVVVAVKGTRVTGSDAAVTSRLLLAALSPSAAAVTALPVAAGYGRAVAVGARRPLILGSGGTSGIATWLTTAAAVHVLAVAPTAVWAESALTPMVTAITARTATTTPSPAPTPAPTTPTVTSAAATAVTPEVPATFVLTGSGYGHGVGMSQYGARGMALAGKSATDIVTHYYTGTTVAPVRDDMTIRVNLLHLAKKSVFRSEALATGGGGIEVTLAGKAPIVGTPADTFTVVPATTSVTLLKTTAGSTKTVGTGTDVVIKWAGTRDPGAAGKVATVLNVATSTSAFAGTGHRYRYGTVVVKPATSGSFEVVNRLRLHDEYLRGIAEVSSSWPAASLQAQVLAARSYALTKAKTLRSACLCHLDDGGGPYFDQTFAGWVKESSAGGKAWRDAVTATYANTTVNGTTVLRGNAILSAGVPITAFYFAASGGRTQSAAEVWGGGLPWAQSVDDPWSLDPTVPWSTWIPRERTQAQMAGAFGLPNVVRVDLSSRTAGGGVKTAVAWSSTGASASISGESLRSRLALPSTWVTRVADVRSGDAATIAARVAARSTSATVVLAPIADPASVAVAGNLAAQKGWPLLLTASDALSAVTKKELLRRSATTVYAVGTTAGLPAALIASVDAVAGTVTRVTGTNSTGVSVNAAKLLAPPTGSVAIVVGAPDLGSLAVAVGAARARKAPLLVLPGGEATSSAVPAYLSALAPSETVVIGSVAAVGDAVAATLPHVSRLTGADANETAARAAAWIGISAARQVVLAKAAAPVSAIALSPGSPVLLVDTTVPTATKLALQRGVSRLVSGPNVGSAVVAAARRL